VTTDECGCVRYYSRRGDTGARRHGCEWRKWKWWCGLLTFLAVFIDARVYAVDFRARKATIGYGKKRLL
jgi:hypothetical protein